VRRTLSAFAVFPQESGVPDVLLHSRARQAARSVECNQVESAPSRAMTPYLKFLSQIVNQSIFVFLMVGAAFALLVGLMLVLNSERAFRIGDRLDRWVSTRAAVKPLEEFRNISRPLYRMHRLVGALICAGALYSLVVLGLPSGEAAISKSLKGIGPTYFAAWISESLRYILLAGNLGALLFGLVFIVRPSALKSLEAWADRRISERKAVLPLEKMRLSADQFLRRHPKAVGVLVILGSLYVLLNLGYALLR
jgi:hypothetical protein